MEEKIPKNVLERIKNEAEYWCDGDAEDLLPESSVEKALQSAYSAGAEIKNEKKVRAMDSMNIPQEIVEKGKEIIHEDGPEKALKFAYVTGGILSELEAKELKAENKRLRELISKTAERFNHQGDTLIQLGKEGKQEITLQESRIREGEWCKSEAMQLREGVK